MNLPRFLIDDTAELGDARVFVTHTDRPRFVGELFIEDENGNTDAPLLNGGVTLSVSATEVLAAIDWIDDPIFDPNELIPALRGALETHWLIRESM